MCRYILVWVLKHYFELVKALFNSFIIWWVSIFLVNFFSELNNLIKESMLLRTCFIYQINQRLSLEVSKISKIHDWSCPAAIFEIDGRSMKCYENTFPFVYLNIFFKSKGTLSHTFYLFLTLTLNLLLFPSNK